MASSPVRGARDVKETTSAATSNVTGTTRGAGGSRAERPHGPLRPVVRYSGIRTAPPVNTIASPVAGASAMSGRFPAVSGGTSPTAS